MNKEKTMMSDTPATAYYLPEPSPWPLLASITLALMFVGAAVMLNGSPLGTFLMGAGFALFLLVLYGWFGTVVRESLAGLYNRRVDISFRWGMVWFIVSEVMFFAGFFGALFYARLLSVPWLGGAGTGWLTNTVLWPEYTAQWPALQLPDATHFTLAEHTVGAWGVPAINTIILLSSGLTITLAHWALKRGEHRGLVGWLLATWVLGLLFVVLQAGEYGHAYTELNFTMNSGIYGTVFYMLTGFHGLHVTIGSIMLIVIWLRAVRGDFNPRSHFAFEAVAWYWHFVDVVWLLLFVLVYWL